MVECICIDSKGRPKEIPTSKWPKENKVYHITHIYMHHMQGVQGVDLKEIKPGKESFPYETYKLSRFGITLDNLAMLTELAIACSGLDAVGVSKLLEESELEILNE